MNTVAERLCYNSEMITLSLSLLFSLLTLLLIGWVVVQLPADYFIRERRHHWIDPQRYPNLAWMVRLVQHAVGYLLVALGIVLLFLPGQGVLTIVIGLMLVEFPGKRRLLHRLLAHERVRKTLDFLRRKAGREPFFYP